MVISLYIAEKGNTCCGNITTHFDIPVLVLGLDLVECTVKFLATMKPEIVALFFLLIFNLEVAVSSSCNDSE